MGSHLIADTDDRHVERWMACRDCVDQRIFCNDAAVQVVGLVEIALICLDVGW